jgi:hypothetical protein
MTDKKKSPCGNTDYESDNSIVIELPNKFNYILSNCNAFLLSQRGRKRLMKSGNIEYFKHLSQFDSLRSFNNAIEQWMVDIKDQFTKSEIIALKRLIRFSAKFPGVCNAKIQTMVSATHTNEYTGISRSTFKRMLSKAIKLGLLVVHNTFKNGKQSHSVYVFNSYKSVTDKNVQKSLVSDVVEPPKQEQLNQQETISPLETNNIKDINKRKQNVQLDSTYCSDSINPQFKKLITAHFGDDFNLVNEYWHMVMVAAWRNSCEKRMVQVNELAYQSFKQMIGKLKGAGNKVRKPVAYFFGVLEKKLEDLYFEDLEQLRL